MCCVYLRATKEVANSSAIQCPRHQALHEGADYPAGCRLSRMRSWRRDLENPARRRRSRSYECAKIVHLIAWSGGGGF